jgi:hypothetical protein
MGHGHVSRRRPSPTVRVSVSVPPRHYLNRTTEHLSSFFFPRLPTDILLHVRKYQSKHPPNRHVPKKG